MPMSKEQEPGEDAAHGLELRPSAGTVVTTDAVGMRDRSAFWADEVCAHLVAVECDTLRAAAPFHGRIDLRDLAGLTVSQICSTAQRVVRTPKFIAQSDQGCYLVNIQREGRSVLRQGRHDVVLEPGDLTVYASDRPYELMFDDDFRQTVLLVPAPALQALMPDIDRHLARPIDKSCSANPLLVQLADSLHGLDPAAPLPVLQAGAESLMQVLAAALKVSGGDVAPASTRLARYHLERIKQYVKTHLHDPSLSVSRVAAATGLSSAHVHRLFAAEGGTFGTWLWSQRLDACRRELNSPLRHSLTLAELAYRWGFKDYSHFSKAFKARFGMSPRDCRPTTPAGALTGTAASSASSASKAT